MYYSIAFDDQINVEWKNLPPEVFSLLEECTLVIFRDVQRNLCSSWHGCSLKISLPSQKKKPGSVVSINYLKGPLRLRMRLYTFFSRNDILLLFLTLKKKTNKKNNLRPANQSTFFISSFYSLNYPQFHLPTDSSSPRCSLLPSGSMLHSHSIH